MKPFRFVLNFLFICIACLSFIGHGSCAEANKTDTGSSFPSEVFSRFSFEANAMNVAISHTKAKMISMPDSGCISNAQQRLKFLNDNLLGKENKFDQIIHDALKNGGIIEPLREWAKTTLGQLNEASKRDLLAIPSNALSDEIVAQWLWGRFDSTPMFQFSSAATVAWSHICASLTNHSTGPAQKAAQVR